MPITPIARIGPCLLWMIDLDAELQDTGCLSRPELERADRFVFPQHRARYIAAHAALREILSAQTGIAAADLAFTEGEFGKPALAGHTGLHFNLSHSHSIGLVGVSREGEIGVDVEQLHAVSDALALAQTCFTPREVESLLALPANARDRAFLSGWTRKEAVIKALGLGMSADLQSLEVGLEHDERLLSCMVGRNRHQLLTISIPMGEGMLGAVAYDAPQPGGHAAPEKAALVGALP